MAEMAAWQALDAVHKRMLKKAQKLVVEQAQKRSDPVRFYSAFFELLRRRLFSPTGQLDIRGLADKEKMYLRRVEKCVDEIAAAVREAQCSPEEGDAVLARLLMETAHELVRPFIARSAAQAAEQMERRFKTRHATGVVEYAA